MFDDYMAAGVPFEQSPDTWHQNFAARKAQGVNYIGASLKMRLTNKDGAIAASDYAMATNAANIKVIALK